MTLLITVFAAVFCTAAWYQDVQKREMKIGLLCWLFWGASLMWFVDAIFAYRKRGAAYFRPTPTEMLNDTFLGLSVVALGLVIWIVYVLIKDPKGVVRSKLFNK